MARQFPRIRLRIGGHALDAVKYSAGWEVCCPSWPALAAQHAGCDDLSELLTEFERRAGGGVPRVRCEVLDTNPRCVVFFSEG